jgi:hypothetical protein
MAAAGEHATSAIGRVHSPVTLVRTPIRPLAYAGASAVTA